eukprot:scaffold629_cov30-Tisochrysis_lutea.AAC.1
MVSPRTPADADPPVGNTSASAGWRHSRGWCRCGRCRPAGSHDAPALPFPTDSRTIAHASSSKGQVYWHHQWVVPWWATPSNRPPSPQQLARDARLLV